MANRWLGLADNDKNWCQTTHEQLDVPGFFEHQLALVGLRMAVRAAYLLTHGNGKKRPPDPDAAADCPVPLDELAALHTRVTDIRDTILHFLDQGDGARLDRSWSTGKPIMFRATPGAGRGKDAQDIDSDEVRRIVETLRPWFIRHRDRHVASS